MSLPYNQSLEFNKIAYVFLLLRENIRSSAARTRYRFIFLF